MRRNGVVQGDLRVLAELDVLRDARDGVNLRRDELAGGAVAQGEHLRRRMKNE